MEFTARKSWKLSLPDDPGDRERLLDAAAKDPAFETGGNTTGNLIEWLIGIAETGGLSFLPAAVLVEGYDLTWAAVSPPPGDSGFSERMEIAGAVSQKVTEWLWAMRGFSAGGRRGTAGQEYEIADPEDEGYRRGYDDEDMETYVLVRRKSDGAVFQIEIEPLVGRAREVKPEPEPTAPVVACPADLVPREIDGQLAFPGLTANTESCCFGSTNDH